MLGGQRLGSCLAVWAGMLAVCGSVLGQSPFLAPRNTSLSSPQGSAFARPEPAATYYFGVMGQVARPGVYALSNSQPQLMDLIRHAGGLTQKATNQIRIVRHGNAGQFVYFSPSLDFRLLAGDIIVADGRPAARSKPHPRQQASPSLIQTADYREPTPADFSDSIRQVALVNMLDRPVILPVPETHANLTAILAYLRQNSAMAGDVTVLPVGPLPPGRSQEATASAIFSLPTVLYFKPRSVQTARLPEFPDVYRVEDQNVTPPGELPKESQTAPPALTLPSVPSATAERFQRPAPHSVVILPPPTETVAEPPMIAKVRDLENRIPSPVPVPSAATLADGKPATPLMAKPLRAVNPSPGDDTSDPSWWPYLGMVLLVLVALGFFTKLGRSSTLPELAVAKSFDDVSVPPDNICIVPLATGSETNPPQSEVRTSPVLETQVLIGDDILAALVFNQLPVLEETTESPAANPVPDRSPSRKIFRLDPPEEQQSAVVPPPCFVKPRSKNSQGHRDVTGPPHANLRASANPSASKSPPTGDAAEAQPSASLLDRVLRQVNHPHAA